MLGGQPLRDYRRVGRVSRQQQITVGRPQQDSKPAELPHLRWSRRKAIHVTRTLTERVRAAPCSGPQGALDERDHIFYQIKQEEKYSARKGNLLRALTMARATSRTIPPQPSPVLSVFTVKVSRHVKHLF